MRTAYYSRNGNSSRSYNAEVAEGGGRYPRTRAAKALGLSVKAFDNGCNEAGYWPNEWHHVSKYANEVDYYDTEELAADPLFWSGARNKRNKKMISENLKKLAAESLENRLADAMPEIDRDRKNNFSKAVAQKLHIEVLRNLYLIGLFDAAGENVLIDVAWKKIKPFDLSAENIKKITRSVSEAKFRMFLEKMDRMSRPKFSFKRENVERIIKRFRDGIVHNNSLMACTPKEWLVAGKILKTTGDFDYEIKENNFIEIKRKAA